MCPGGRWTARSNCILTSSRSSSVANDLVKHRVDVAALAAEVEHAVVRLRAIGADVLLVTPFLPGRRAAAVYTRRFAAFATALTGIAARTGAILIDTDLHPALAERPNWGEDLVHLSSRGHRLLAYRAAEILGVPDADALGILDAALHEHEPIGAGAWCGDTPFPGSGAACTVVQRAMVVRRSMRTTSISVRSSAARWANIG